MVAQCEVPHLAWITEQSGKLGKLYGSNRDDREDFKQEAAIKAVEVFRRHPNADYPYVLRAMFNHCLSLLRRRKVREHLDSASLAYVPEGADGFKGGTWGDDWRDLTETIVGDDAPDPLECAAFAIDLCEALSVLDSMPEHLRAVMVASVSVGVSAHCEAAGITKDRYYVLLAEARALVPHLLTGTLPSAQTALAL